MLQLVSGETSSRPAAGPRLPVSSHGLSSHITLSRERAERHKQCLPRGFESWVVEGLKESQGGLSGT